MIPFAFMGKQPKQIVQFIAQAFDTNIFAYTKDAKNWIQGTLPSSQTIYCGICVGGKWIMPSRSNAIVFNSNDGINWTSSALPQVGGAITYGNGVYIIVTGYGTGTANYLYSNDGVNWVIKTFPLSQIYISVCYGNNVFVAIAYNSNTLFYSIDGINWTESASPSISFWTAYGNNLFVSIPLSGNYCITSPDGKTWTQRTLPVTINANIGNSIAYGNDVFVILEGSKNVLTSSDGINWTEYNANIIGNCITFGNGLFLITSNGSTFSTSPDGKTWTVGNMPSSQNWFTAISSNASSANGVSDGGDDDPDPEKGT